MIKGFCWAGGSSQVIAECVLQPQLADISQLWWGVWIKVIQYQSVVYLVSVGMNPAEYKTDPIIIWKQVNSSGVFRLVAGEDALGSALFRKP